MSTATYSKTHGNTCQGVPLLPANTVPLPINPNLAIPDHTEGLESTEAFASLMNVNTFPSYATISTTDTGKPLYVLQSMSLIVIVELCCPLLQVHWEFNQSTLLGQVVSMGLGTPQGLEHREDPFFC